MEHKTIEKVVFTLAVAEPLLSNIDSWRYANRIPSRAAAIRKLIAQGLKAEKKGGD